MSDKMKTITLRTLVREPVKVKRWTRRGVKVQVTDSGQPLWLIQAADDRTDEPGCRQAVDKMLSEVLHEPKSPVSLSRLIKESRR
jgi:hypothetical protein